MEDMLDEKSKKPVLDKEKSKEHESYLFNKLKGINTPIKNELLIALSDGNWHSESELIRTAKKERQYAGSVLVGTMLNSINALSQDIFLKKSIINGEWHFKISDNYVGLTRAAFTRSMYRKCLDNE